MTGRYQTRFGHEFNPGEGDTVQGLPLSETFAAARLKAAGYTTGLRGKWHLGGLPEYHPLERGFDSFYGFLGGAHDYFKPNGILRDKEPAQTTEYLTDTIGQESARFIETNKGKPWFLYVAFNAVHTPMQADDARLKVFESITDPQRRTLAAMTLAMDEAVGRITNALKDSGQADNTLVAFISDNGGPTMKGTTTNASINKPFRGSKRTTLEGGIHVPFLVSWPGRVPVGIYEKPVIQLDLTATALAVAGVDTSSAKLEGVDLLPFVTGAKTSAPHDALYWRFGDQMAIRDGDYKLVRYDLNADTNTGANQPASEAKLYDLSKDIGESKDLAATMPDKVKALQSKWDAWDKSNVAPLWGGKKAGGGKKAKEAAE
jgi:arylsulfatase A-like enzyme